MRLRLRFSHWISPEEYLLAGYEGQRTYAVWLDGKRLGKLHVFYPHGGACTVGLDGHIIRDFSTSGENSVAECLRRSFGAVQQTLFTEES